MVERILARTISLGVAPGAMKLATIKPVQTQSFHGLVRDPKCYLGRSPCAQIAIPHGSSFDSVMCDHCRLHQRSLQHGIEQGFAPYLVAAPNPV